MSKAEMMWRGSRVSSVSREYTIINDGIIRREDYNILFENGTGKRYIPKETAEALNIYSDVISSKEEEIIMLHLVVLWATPILNLK